MAVSPVTFAKYGEKRPVPSESRVLGWDLLRGLCALSVSFYHLLSWLKLAEYHSWGLYGVYIFFILSGASLVYTYNDKFNLRQFSFKNFLIARYYRLAPLYILLLLLLLPWKIGKETLSEAFILKIITNLLFLFGIYHPVGQSMLVGGWSLGIEFIFYLLFPLILRILKFPRRALFLWAILLALKTIWINETLGSDGSPDLYNIVLYHHLPAFAAYFMGGCVIGRVIRENNGSRKLGGLLQFVVLVSAFCVMPALGSSMTDALTGWNGVLLTFLCFVLVAYAGSYVFSGKLITAVAKSFGNATYGLYLIHPVIYFGLSYFLLPKLGVPLAPDEWVRELRIVFSVGVIFIAYLLALASEKFFERPVRVCARNFFKMRYLASKA